MAVIVSNGATTLATASGFYRAEAYNLSPYSTTMLALSSTRTLDVTFANAGNCQGIILHLAASSHVNKDVTVVLQENVASVWTDRATKTLTAAQISNSVAANTQATWIQPFIFGTPYAVDTTASKWRFSISQGAGTNNWSLRTSNGTAIAYVTWCDTAVSYATNDVLIAKDVVTVDMTCQFNGLLSTGDSTNSICGIACTGSTGDYTANGMIVWDSTPAASYTMTINGFFVFGAHSGFHVGDASNRIPFAQQAIVKVIAATAGTATNSGLSMGGNANNATVIGRMNVQMYGEIPTTRSTTLASDAAAAQPNIVTSTSTGWAVNDQIAICKADIAGSIAEVVPYTISTIAGTAIAVSPNISTNARKSGGHVFNLNRYGIKFETTHTATIIQYLNAANSLIFSGVLITGFYCSTSNGTSQWYDSSANIGDITIEDCALTNGSVTTSVTTLGSCSWGNTKAMTIQRNHFFRTNLVGTFYGPVLPLKTIVDNIFLTGGILGFTRIQNITLDGNYFYNASSYPLHSSSGIYNSTFSDNYFWGAASGTIRNDGGLGNVTWTNNQHERSTRAFWNFAAIINNRCTNEKYGLEATISYIYVGFAGYSPYAADFVIDNPQIGASMSPTQNDTEGVDGAKIRFQTYDEVANTDFTHMPYGTIVRTGAGLTDTTVRTSGGFAMRFEPIYSPYLMHWEQTIPTGDIDTKTMTISVWVYINNAAYYAGTHTKPTLTVTYDNGTEISAVAAASAGAWQQLAVTFTPATSFGQVEMKITGATDATGTNRYFYVDDVNIAYPAGVAVDLGNLDLWADGLPVAPAIATVPSLGGVWDEALTAHTIPGTFGYFVKKLLSVAKFLGLK